MRTIFNNIISHDNLETKPIEYIYNFNMIWEEGTHTSINVEYGIIVENVEQEESGSYTFNIKGSEKRYSCTYGWAFVENTEENKEIIRLLDIEQKKLDVINLDIKILKLKLTGLFDYRNGLTKQEARKIKLKNLE